MTKGALRLYNKLKSKNYQAKNICEIGVFKPEESNVLQFIEDGKAVTLIEATPQYAENLRNYFANRDNVTIIEAAIYDFNGTIELCKREASTFISELESSPAIINDKANTQTSESFTAKSIKFSEIDHGDFDLLSVDIEGAEWYVIKHIISKPKVISLETHGKYYTNPFIIKIKEWMKSNNYILWYKDGTDSVYIKKSVFSLSLYEKLLLYFINIKISILRKKKYLKRIVG